MENIPITLPPNANGVRLNTFNLHSKQPSGIAKRLKQAGVDWVVDLAKALNSNDDKRIGIWLRLLPYLIVTQGHKRIVSRKKNRPSKAALAALDALENE